MKTGTQLITEERLEQLNKHNFSLENDKTYTEEQLVDAAAHYLIADAVHCWPHDWDMKWYKTGDRILELRRAGGLIAAEIDRLQGTTAEDYRQLLYMERKKQEIEAQATTNLDYIGTQVDRIDNVVEMLKNERLPPVFHVEQLRTILPEISQQIKTYVTNGLGHNPWE
jgi:hypothetical protein